jgi:hypothetical protein
MTKDAPSLTDAQFLEQFARTSRRLTSHLNHLDDGDIDLADDVATLTRTFLAYGEGDKAISRLCKRFHLTPPPVELSGEPNRAANVEFAAGNLPQDTHADDLAGAHSASIDAWLRSTAIVSGTVTRRETTWNQLIAHFGNTFGAHLSHSVPEVLGTIGLYGAPGGSLAIFLLRSAAVTAENALRELLPQVGLADSAAPPREIALHGLRLGRVAVMKTQGESEPAATVEFRMGESKDMEIIRMPIGGKMLTARTVLDKDGNARLAVRYI